MKLTRAQRSKFSHFVFLDRGAKFFRQPGRLESRQRQMRRKRPLFARDAKFFRGAVDISRQVFQIRRSLDAGPENARAFFVWEKAESAKIERDDLMGAGAGQSAANGRELCFRSFTNEFKR